MNITVTNVTEIPQKGTFNLDPGMEMYGIILLLVFYSILLSWHPKLELFDPASLYEDKSSSTTSANFPQLPGLHRIFSGTGIHTGIYVQHAVLAQLYVFHL